MRPSMLKIWDCMYELDFVLSYLGLLWLLLCWADIMVCFYSVHDGKESLNF